MQVFSAGQSGSQGTNRRFTSFSCASCRADDPSWIRFRSEEPASDDANKQRCGGKTKVGGTNYCTTLVRRPGRCAWRRSLRVAGTSALFSHGYAGSVEPRRSPRSAARAASLAPASNPAQAGLAIPPLRSANGGRTTSMACRPLSDHLVTPAWRKNTRCMHPRLLRHPAAVTPVRCEIKGSLASSSPAR